MDIDNNSSNCKTDLNETVNDMKCYMETLIHRQNVLREKIRNLELKTSTLLNISSRQELALQDLHRANNNNVQTIHHILEKTDNSKSYKMHKTPTYNTFFALPDTSETNQTLNADQYLFYISP